MGSFDPSRVIYKKASLEDADNLLKLIIKSTNGKTKLNKTMLMNDLFDYATSSFHVKIDHPYLDIDTKLFKSNTSIASSFVAKIENNIIGYAISHYHYSPWPGNCCFIDDIYVLPEYRSKGIGRKLFSLVIDKSKNERMRNVYFNNINDNNAIMELFSGKKTFVSRNDKKDWSVLRIDYM